MVLDLTKVRQRYDLWTRLLPTVKPFYAVKCNPHPEIIRQLSAIGAGFDCASRLEMMRVLRTSSEPDIILANPIKSPADLRYARSRGIKRMTLDNLDELEKIHALFPDAELVVRILVDDRKSRMPFGLKFGASNPLAIILRASELCMRIIGVSFHVGSGCLDARQYSSAIQRACVTLKQAQQAGHDVSVLDIGGGFPGCNDAEFETMARVVRHALHVHCPPTIRVVAEPGRFFVAAAGMLFARINGKRIQCDGTVQYYMNDGVYGSFNNVIFDRAAPVPMPLENLSGLQTTSVALMRASTLFGPTCDAMDVICTNVPLREHHVGEWLLFNNMGAYTTASASTFNGMPGATIAYIPDA